MRAYLCGSKVHGQRLRSHTFPPLAYEDDRRGVVTGFQATVSHPRDIRFIRSRGVTSSRIVELRGDVSSAVITSPRWRAIESPDLARPRFIPLDLKV